mgnify:CR=1 FL=1
MLKPNKRRQTRLLKLSRPCKNWKGARQIREARRFPKTATRLTEYEPNLMFVDSRAINGDDVDSQPSGLVDVPELQLSSSPQSFNSLCGSILNDFCAILCYNPRR